MDRKQLDARIKELEEKRNSSPIFNTSREAKDLVSSIKDGMYWGEMALMLFQNLKSQRFSIKRSLRRMVTSAIIAAGISILIQVLRQYRGNSK